MSTTFADRIRVKSYDGTLQRRLTSLGLSRDDVDAIAREVRRETGPEGAVITERRRPDSEDVDALSPHWRRLSGALRQAEARKDMEDLGDEVEEEEAEGATYVDKESESNAAPFDATMRERRLKELRHKYRTRQPKSLPAKAKSVTKTKAKTVTRTKAKTGTKSHDHCSCGGQCGSCAFDRCHTLGEQLERLDVALDLARQELQVQEIARQTKEAVNLWAGKSFESTPTAHEVLAKIKLLKLRDERSAAWDAMAAAGCEILRKDAAATPGKA
jgi:hypothetical protein